MSGLDNLTKRIKADSQQKIDSIILEAQAEADSIIKGAIASVESQKQLILKEGASLASTFKERSILAKNLTIRDEGLEKKQITLDKVFNTALERLNSLNKEDYLAFLINSLEPLKTKGCVIILPRKYNLSIEEVNEQLVKKGLSGGLLDYKEEPRDLKGGFILIDNAVEQNYSFSSMLRVYRYELESQVLNILY